MKIGKPEKIIEKYKVSVEVFGHNLTMFYCVYPQDGVPFDIEPYREEDNDIYIKFDPKERDLVCDEIAQAMLYE
jgi:hypothetical protein